MDYQNLLSDTLIKKGHPISQAAFSIYILYFRLEVS